MDSQFITPSTKFVDLNALREGDRLFQNGTSNYAFIVGIEKYEDPNKTVNKFKNIR